MVTKVFIDYELVFHMKGSYRYLYSKYFNTVFEFKRFLLLWSNFDSDFQLRGSVLEPISRSHFNRMSG